MQRIKAGEYPPGSKLPSATELADLYGISVSTANRVFTLLRERGVTVGVVGRGVYVALKADRPAE